MKKRIFSLLLALAVVFNFTATSVFAAGGDKFDHFIETTITETNEKPAVTTPGTEWTGPKKLPYLDLNCRITEHTHGAGCYNTSNCNHAHDDSCYDCDHECFWGIGGCLVTVCNNHFFPWDHDFSCYRCTHDHNGCTLECTHTHTDECYVYECEHVNHALVLKENGGCYVHECLHNCSEADGCYNNCNHKTHTNACFVNCAHQHTNDCRTWQCKYYHYYGNNHNPSCYTNCTHVHNADDPTCRVSCIHTSHTPSCRSCTHSCSVESGCYKLDCTHDHVDSCKDISCTTREHTHGEGCYITKYRYEWTLVWKTYTIKWTNAKGEVIKTDKVKHGDKPEYKGAKPTMEPTAEFTYEFVGWAIVNEVEPTALASDELNKGVVEADKDVTYKPVFNAIRNEYTVTWKNEDGKTLEVDENVPYGTMPTYDGKKPSKEATKQYTYTFAGWNKEVVEVTGNVEYTATYKATVNVYDVVWVDEDGTTILEIDKNVEYGTEPSFDKDEPTKAATEKYTYTFAGWTPLIVTVEGDVVYKATYKEAIKKFAVTYIVDDEVIEAVEVEYGKDATAPEIPAKEGYTAKWDKDGKNITEDTEITAVYTAIPVEEPEAPTTGDTTNAGLYLVLMAAAALVLKKRGEQI